MELSNTPYSLAATVGKPVLYVVRHGCTGDDNSYNSPVNPNLDAKGWEDARAAANFLSKLRTGSLHTSGFKRSAETANVVGKAIEVAPQIDNRLDSWDVGTAANASSAEEADRIIQHHVDNPDKVIPGGESLAHLRERVTPAFMDGVQEGISTGKPPVYVAHHSVQHEVGRVFNNDKDSALTHTGGVTAVYLTPAGFKAVAIFRPEKA